MSELDKITAGEVIEEINKAVKGKDDILSPKERMDLFKGVFDERLFDENGNLIKYDDLSLAYRKYIDFTSQPNIVLNKTRIRNIIHYLQILFFYVYVIIY